MRVLVTNDDGIDAPGLRHLARAAADRGHDVVVAAPDAEASGVSAALSAVAEEGRVVVERHELKDLAGVPAYGVAASPAYIVVLAGLGAFGDPPDVVLSGINRGANAGHAVLHSGTVGAALTAAAAGRSALAVSLDVLTPGTASAASGGNAIAALDLVDDEARHWATAAELAGRLLPALGDAPAGTVLNLNVPDRPADRVAGVRRATLSRFGQTQMAIAEAGEGFVRTAVEESGARTEDGTDLALLAEGYATVTPIQAVGEATGVDIDLDVGSGVPESGPPVSRVGRLDRGR
jgi:5'-nucleotidase